LRSCARLFRRRVTAVRRGRASQAGRPHANLVYAGLSGSPRKFAESYASRRISMGPKGEAFALIHGGQLHKIRMPLPSAASDPLMPTSLAAIGETLRARLDGAWNQPEEAAESEDRRDV
jgi:hypothetical protein